MPVIMHFFNAPSNIPVETLPENVTAGVYPKCLFYSLLQYDESLIVELAKQQKKSYIYRL